MPYKLLQKTFSVLLRRQTNILSAAFVIMATVVFSQILGLVRQRLLVAFFGPSNTLGVYLASTKFPDFLFQLIVAGALSSAFIPVFSDFLSKGKNKEAHQMASTLLTFGLLVFLFFSIILLIFTPFFLQLFNIGAGFSKEQMDLMASLTRIIIFGELLFVIGTFFSVVLQSYSHFFIPGIAAGVAGGIDQDAKKEQQKSPAQPRFDPAGQPFETFFQVRRQQHANAQYIKRKRRRQVKNALLERDRQRQRSGSPQEQKEKRGSLVRNRYFSFTEVLAPPKVH